MRCASLQPRRAAASVALLSGWDPVGGYPHEGEPLPDVGEVAGRRELCGGAPWKCGSDLLRCVARTDEGSDRVGVAAHADRLYQAVAQAGGPQYTGKHGSDGLVRIQ